MGVISLIHANSIISIQNKSSIASALLPLFSSPSLSATFSLLPHKKSKTRVSMSSISPPSEEKPKTDSLNKFRLNEKTFLASLMPKKEIGVDRFLESYPEYDGRGALIAIFDSGVDPAAAGLQVTSDGKPKIIDILDCTGSGDVDTSKVVKAEADGSITGASGVKLFVNPSWTNPSQEWHVGYKLVYELFTDTLTSRVKAERKKKWDEKNQDAISEALKHLNEFDKKYPKTNDTKLRKDREDLQSKLDFLRKQTEVYDDRGPVIDVVVWNDENVWRVAVDTQSLEDSSDVGKLADFVPLTNYRTERKYGIFSKLDACSFVTNVYDEGNLVSIVTDCSPHGTHVAGITSAYHPEEPLLNGAAPGAQLISCKIGDARLGSMETGTGLTRALIAAVEHKVDLINMSYGESTMLPNYGRFVDLVNEAVDKHRVIFVSSAGNNGPALSTVGSPGGTSSSIIGVGAYVSPAMAAGAHCVVEPPNEGMEYTWSSRGPTVDGDRGVCISAPGGAVAPVPTWTLQRRMLMNGTSMSSPSACGGIALLVSGMKAEGIPVSPYTVRKALESTAVPIGDKLEDKLTTGQGLMQVDRAYQFLQKSRELTCVCYKISINQSGKTTPTFRGIYLRGASACQQTTEAEDIRVLPFLVCLHLQAEDIRVLKNNIQLALTEWIMSGFAFLNIDTDCFWTIQVNPGFHEGASNLEQLVPFEECIQLISSEKSVALPPEYLLLTHNGRSFNIVVDPTHLSNGLHHHEVYGIDCKAPWRGPLFRVPITILKPTVPAGEPPKVLYSSILFTPGHIERKFVDVPHGATWVEATMQTSGFDTARRFFIDAVQISPLVRPMKWEAVATFSSPSFRTFTFAVKGGLTMELAIAQFWSSGIGSHEPTTVDFEIVFHGISINQDAVLFDGSDAPIRIDAESLLASERLVPSATLNKIRTPFRPVESNISTLPTSRDRLPSGKQIMALTLFYKFKLEEGAEIKPHLPLLNNRIYDTKFESQFYIITDANKRSYASGDVYPDYVKIPKGEYTLRLYIRHENVQLLEKMKQLVLFIERKLEKKDFIQLSFFSQPDGSMMGNGSFKSSTLIPGNSEAFYVGPPSKDKIPKSCQPGSVLIGSITYGVVSFSSKKADDDHPQTPPISYEISYIIPPSKIDDDRGNGSSNGNKSISDKLQEEVRDAKIKILSGLKQTTEEEKTEWKKFSVSLKEEYPNYTPLLAKILEGLLSRGSGEDKIQFNEEIIKTADEVIDSVDKNELAKWIYMKLDPEDEEAEAIKKKMEATRDHLVEALYRKGLALVEIKFSKVPSEPNGFEENFKELKKWVDNKSPKYIMLLVLQEKRNGRLGIALKALNDLIQDESEPPKKKLYDMKIKLLDEMGWGHVASYERQWLHVRFPSSLPLF